jgi:hypothetical protein
MYESGTYNEAEGKPRPASHNMSRVIAAIMASSLNPLVTSKVRGEFGLPASEDETTQGCQLNGPRSPQDSLTTYFRWLIELKTAGWVVRILME